MITSTKYYYSTRTSNDSQDFYDTVTITNSPQESIWVVISCTDMKDIFSDGAVLLLPKPKKKKIPFRLIKFDNRKLHACKSSNRKIFNQFGKVFIA